MLAWDRCMIEAPRGTLNAWNVAGCCCAAWLSRNSLRCGRALVVQTRFTEAGVLHKLSY